MPGRRIAQSGAAPHSCDPRNREITIASRRLISYNLHKNPVLHLFNIVFFHLFKSAKMCYNKLLQCKICGFLPL